MRALPDLQRDRVRVDGERADAVTHRHLACVVLKFRREGKGVGVIFQAGRGWGSFFRQKLPFFPRQFLILWESKDLNFYEFYVGSQKFCSIH